jgi:two-component sensor histidine kinase
VAASLVNTLNDELRDGSPGLVDNTDLLRGVLSGCGDCIKVLDLDGRLIFMSEGGKRVMEVDDFSALKGCPWPGFWGGEGNALATAAVADAKAGKTARFRGATNTAKGMPRYWDVHVSPVFDEAGQPTHLLSISRDITEEWNAAELEKKNAERQHFLKEELQHRVKNTLTTVMAIAGRTFRGAVHALPLQIFSERLITLDKAHEALTASDWDRAAMREIVEGALAPHRTGEGRFTIGGPDLDLNPRQALALALAVNELATNAQKYGALSVPAGTVRIAWTKEDETFRLSWQEAGGPAVTKPARQGFGTGVVTTMLAEDFGGKVDLSYEPAGLSYVLTSPLVNLPNAPASLKAIAAAGR